MWVYTSQFNPNLLCKSLVKKGVDDIKYKVNYHNLSGKVLSADVLPLNVVSFFKSVVTGLSNYEHIFNSNVLILKYIFSY